MIKYVQICILLVTIVSKAQNSTEMIIPQNTNEKFTEFIAKKKFVKENHYPGVAEEEMRPILTEKINKIAVDFQSIATSEKPTEEKYQEQIELGLAGFKDLYLELDTEDRERVCTYIEELMDIVGLQSSNGQLNNFMYGFDPNE